MDEICCKSLFTCKCSSSRKFAQSHSNGGPDYLPEAVHPLQVNVIRRFPCPAAWVGRATGTFPGGCSSLPGRWDPVSPPRRPPLLGSCRPSDLGNLGRVISTPLSRLSHPNTVSCLRTELRPPPAFPICLTRSASSRLRSPGAPASGRAAEAPTCPLTWDTLPPSPCPPSPTARLAPKAVHLQAQPPSTRC